MLQNAKKILEQYIKTGDKICVAVSGGADSMCLLSLVLSSDFIKKSDVLVLNVNHNIRGKNSDSDSEFVESFCKLSGVKFIGKSVDIPAICASTRRSIELEAREARYGLFLDMINSDSVRYVLTAHHADDNVESILMHVFRGCGLSGLKGIDVLSKNWLLRPLVSTFKDEISEYVKTNNIPYVTDETNSQSDYTRNYLRNEIMPLILNKWGGARESILRLAKEAAELSSVIENSAQNLEAIEVSDGIAHIRLTALSGGGLDSGIVFKALKQLGVNSDIERKHIEAVLRLQHQQNGSRIDLKNGICAFREYNKITICKPEKINTADINLMFKSGRTDILNSVIEVNKISVSEAMREVSKALLSNGEEKSFNKTLYADQDKIPKNAVIRVRQNGDKITVFGGNTKKLKEYLIDKKIPKRLRDTLPLLADGNDILAIFGMEISDKIKILPSATCAVALTLKEKENNC